MSCRFQNWDGTHNITGLYANVFRPTGVMEQSKLPVVVVSPRVVRNGALSVACG